MTAKADRNPKGGDAQQAPSRSDESGGRAEVELRACPFCGLHNAKTLPGITRVICMTPGCDAEMGGSTQTEAIARWNRRTPTTPERSDDE